MTRISAFMAHLQERVSQYLLHVFDDTRQNALPSLLPLVSSLSDASLLSTDKQTALQTIVWVCQQAMGSHVCTLTLLDLASGTLTYGAGISVDKALEEALRTEQISLGPRDATPSVHEVIEYSRLPHDGQRITEPHIATEYHLQTGLCYPLHSSGQFFGYLCHFSSQRWSLTEENKALLKLCAVQIVNVLERFEQGQTRDRLHKLFHELSAPDLSLSPNALLDHITASACALLTVPVAIIWMLDADEQRLRIMAATPNVDRRYRALELSRDHFESWSHLFRDRVASLSDVRKPHAQYQHATEARERGWVSLLSAPLRAQDRWIGMLDVYTVQQSRHFRAWEKDAFHAFTHDAALAIEKARLYARQEAAGIREQIDRLSSTSRPNAQPGHELDATLDWIVEQCAMLTRAKTCYLRLVNKVTNQVELRAFYDITRSLPQRPLPQNNALPLGDGVAGHVAQGGKPYICPDTRRDPYYKDKHEGAYHPSIFLDTKEFRVIQRVSINFGGSNDPTISSDQSH